MSSSTPTAHILNAGRNSELMWDYLFKNKISIGWKVGNGDFRQYNNEEIQDMNPSGDDRMFIVKFLGLHDDQEQNINVGDDVIVYAPNPREVVVGVFVVTGEPEYDPHPLQLTDEKHFYYRDVLPKPWSKPVHHDDFQRHFTGTTTIRRSPTLQPCYDDLSEIEAAIRAAPLADLTPDEDVVAQRP